VYLHCQRDVADEQTGMPEMSLSDIQRTSVLRQLNYVPRNVKMSRIGGMRSWISYVVLRDW
jgi:hypothetical protein